MCVRAGAGKDLVPDARTRYFAHETVCFVIYAPRVVEGSYVSCELKCTTYLGSTIHVLLIKSRPVVPEKFTHKSEYVDQRCKT